MAYLPKILAFAGSTREHSLNKKLIKLAVCSARLAGAEVTCIVLRDLPMPLYDGDLEVQQGIPANATIFKELLVAHDGLMISSPEYNGGISGVLKNAIDWASRPLPGEKMSTCFNRKVAVIMSASPGELGGLRGLAQVGLLLANMQVLVLPEMVAIPKANEAISFDGNLNDPKQRTAVEALGFKLVDVLVKLNNC